MKAKLSLIAALVVSLPVHADFVVGLDGRSADLYEQSQMAVELNTSTFDSDTTSVGARFSYKISDTMLAYGDVSQVTVDDGQETNALRFKGQAVGGGIILDVQDLMPSIKTSVKFSYHMADLGNETKLSTEDGRSVTAEASYKSMSAKVMLSPLDPIGTNGLKWFASIGYASVESELSFALPGQTAKQDGEPLKGLAGGVGLIYPLSFGEVYAGYESVDGDGQTGGGIRYNF